MVKRKEQYNNVAFGGGWSESLIDGVKKQEVLAVLRHAAKTCEYTDPRGLELDEALDIVEQTIEKGRSYREAMEKALSIPNQALRRSQAQRCVSQIERWL